MTPSFGSRLWSLVPMVRLVGGTPWAIEEASVRRAAPPCGVRVGPPRPVSPIGSIISPYEHPGCRSVREGTARGRHRRRTAAIVWAPFREIEPRLARGCPPKVLLDQAKRRRRRHSRSWWVQRSAAWIREPTLRHPSHRRGFEDGAAVAVERAALALFLFLPPLAGLLDHAPPPLAVLPVIVLAVSAVLGADAVHKRLVARRRTTPWEPHDEPW